MKTDTTTSTKTEGKAPIIELLKSFPLLVPITVPGTADTPTREIKSITLRRPKVAEIVRFQNQAKDLKLNDAEEELMIYANLSQEKLTMEDIGELDYGDFAKVQRWFRALQSGA